MRLIMESRLPAPFSIVFDLLLKPGTLVFLAEGMVTYHGASEFPEEWRVGEPIDLKPQVGNGKVGSHIVTFKKIDRKHGIIKTAEHGGFIARWNHTMNVVSRGDEECTYIDTIHISAGWRTLFVWDFAKRFYKHRHRRWLELLSQRDSVT